MSHLTDKFDKLKITFVEEPVDVAKGEKKPFEVSVNDVLVYSTLTPIDDEKGPILFSSNKWWGEPVPHHLERLEKAICDAM